MSNRHRCEAARTAVGNGGGGDVDGPPSASSSLRDFYAKHGIDYAGLVASTGSSKQSKNDNVDSGHNNNDNTAEDLDDDQRSPTVPTHRFVRLNPRHDVEKTLRELKAEISIFLKDQRGDSSHRYPLPVPWISAAAAPAQAPNSWCSFYAVPRDFPLAQSSCFREGRIYGQDVSSGAAVVALLTDRYDREKRQEQHSNGSSSPPPHRVLDLCCSPGLKLCAIADFLSFNQLIDGDLTSGGSCLDGKQRQIQVSLSHPAPGASVTVIGVDISESRMAVCKRVVTKYHIDPKTSLGSISEADGNSNRQSAPGFVKIQLYCNDGTEFGMTGGKEVVNLVFDSDVAREQADHRGERKRMNKSARARERKRLKDVVTAERRKLLAVGEAVETTGGTAASMCTSKDQSEPRGEQPSTSPRCCPNIRVELFDRVLVDAECSTDGSLKHVQKRVEKQQQQQKSDDGGGDDLLDIPQLTDRQKLSELVDLQRRLAASGFRLVKTGGYMVYSTCSLSEDQNEGVVEWLLREFPKNAELFPLEFGDGSAAGNSDESVGPSNARESSRLPGTVRFLPGLSKETTLQCDPASGQDPGLFGEGFFLAKIKKSMTSWSR